LVQLAAQLSVLGPKFSILSPQRRDLARQSLNRLKLHQNDADQSFPIKRIKSRAVHPQFESVDDSTVKRHQTPMGGEQLPEIKFRGALPNIAFSPVDVARKIRRRKQDGGLKKCRSLRASKL
jgi:hypothetical protein